MKKHILPLICFSLLVIFGVWALDQNGAAQINWFRINMSIPLWVLCFVMFLIMFGMMALSAGLKCLITKQMSESVKKSTQIQNKIKLKKNDVDEAMFALLKTMTATTEGDMKTARKNLKIVESKIGQGTIVDVLELKILKGEKNFDALEKLSNKLMKNKDSELVGLKALVETSAKKKDFAKALESANRAFQTRQDLYWVIENTFNLRALASDWKGASEVLEAGKNKKMITPEKYRSMKAVAFYEQALEAKKQNETLKFSKYLTEAYDADPSFEPAAVELAKFYENEGQINKADKILKSIWRISPTYEVAKAYMKLYKDDSALERVQRMENFAMLNAKELSLNNLILAELDMKAKLWDKAKSEMEIFLINNPATKKIAHLMSQYEKTVSKNFDAAQSWEKRQKDCPNENVWVCSHCGQEVLKWKPFCDKCGGVNSYKWFLCLKDKR